MVATFHADDGNNLWRQPCDFRVIAAIAAYGGGSGAPQKKESNGRIVEENSEKKIMLFSMSSDLR